MNKLMYSIYVAFLAISMLILSEIYPAMAETDPDYEQHNSTANIEVIVLALSGLFTTYVSIALPERTKRVLAANTKNTVELLDVVEDYIFQSEQLISLIEEGNLSEQVYFEKQSIINNVAKTRISALKQNIEDKMS